MSTIMRLIQKFVFKGGSKPKHFLLYSVLTYQTKVPTPIMA